MSDSNIINLLDYCRAAFEGKVKMKREQLVHAARVLNDHPEPSPLELEQYAIFMGVDPNKEIEHGT